MHYQAAVITVSDRASAGVYEDKSGPAVTQILKEAGYDVVHTSIVPDEKAQISAELIRCADEKHCDLIITSGGTGLSPRDVTPEATRAVLEREIPAIPQAMLYFSLSITPNAMPTIRVDTSSGVRPSFQRRAVRHNTTPPRMKPSR